MNYIKEHIKIRKKTIENELSRWKENRENLAKKIKNHIVDTLFGNRILGHIESLEFCLKEINELLKLNYKKSN
ncbi:hypothetical protein KAH94_04220 [bacterium]|nr:hypothetical protein [bacterium]